MYGLQYRVVYHQGGKTYPFGEDILFDDYYDACKHMQDTANEWFDELGHSGMLTLEVIGLPSIGAR